MVPETTVLIFEKDNITMMFPSAVKKYNKKNNKWLCRSHDFQKKKRMMDIEDITTINASLNDVLHLILTNQNKYDHIYMEGFPWAEV